MGHKSRMLRLSLSISFVICGCFAIQTYGQTKPKDTYILKGGPLGGVKFEHKLHVARDAKCETCHHLSKPQKPLASPQQACTGCHTMPATPPMKINRLLAFHNPMATAGTCIDCHKVENAKGKKAPVKCIECHLKSNV